MRLVVTSDNKHESLTYPEGDVFIHCGDITRFGTIFELRKFVNFLSELNFKYKIVIGGNHDFCLSDFRRKKTEKILNDNGVIYLNNSSINIKGVNFWGSPVQPKFFNMAFNKDRGEEIKKYWDNPISLNNDKNLVNKNFKYEKFFTLLKEAVKNQIHGEVGFSSYLSGGIDSSVISYLLTQIQQSPIDTFSVEFENKEYDESDAQQSVKKIINSISKVN